MEGAYQTTSLWKFPRVHLWGDVQHALVTPALYPDQQQRLSLKELAGGRHEIHSGSPYGSGEWAPCSVEHHKFLVRSLHDRRSIIQRYDGIRRGAGSQFKEWQTPEDVYSPAELATKVVEWDGETLTRRAA
jgi:hypothetical protein